MRYLRAVIALALTATIIYLAIWLKVPEAQSALKDAFIALTAYIWAEHATLLIPGKDGQ